MLCRYTFVKIKVTAPIKSTEDSSRVKQAVLNIFPDAAIEEHEGKLEGTASNAENLKRMLETQKIRDTARWFLKKNVKDGKLSFKLNKQAAYAGKVNFAIFAHPMGEIEVQIEPEENESIDDFIEWLAEKEEQNEA